MAVSQAFQNQEVLAGTCIGNNAVEAVVFCELKAFAESALTPTAVCVFVLVPLLPMVVAQESAQTIDTAQPNVLDAQDCANCTQPLSAALKNTCQFGFIKSPHIFRSFSIVILQVQLVTSFILTAVIVPVIADALGVYVSGQAVIAVIYDVNVDADNNTVHPTPHRCQLNVPQEMAHTVVTILYVLPIVGATVFNVAVVTPAAFLFRFVSLLFVASRQLVNVQLPLVNTVHVSGGTATSSAQSVA